MLGNLQAQPNYEVDLYDKDSYENNYEPDSPDDNQYTPDYNDYYEPMEKEKSSYGNNNDGHDKY